MFLDLKVFQVFISRTRGFYLQFDFSKVARFYDWHNVTIGLGLFEVSIGFRRFW
jgi:hypothetical protein